MNTQKLLSVLFTAFFLSLALVSAAVSFTATSPATLTKLANSTTFTITAIENVTLSIPSTVSLGNATVSVSPNGNVAIDTSAARTITLTTTAFPTNIGVYTGSFVITNATATDNQTITVTYNKGFCDYGAINVNSSRYLEITSIKDSSSDDDWEWKPLDEVTVDVKVRFTNDADDDDSIDTVVELGLYDTEENEFIELGSGDDTLEEELSLDEGKTGTVSFTVKVPVEVEDSSSRYKIYAKAYEDGEEDTLCRDYSGSDYSQAVKIEKNSYDVTLKDITVTDEVPCGQEARVTVNANNVGMHDEDRILVSLSNSALGVELNSSTFSIDEGDEDPYKITFTFLIPKNVTEGTYQFSLYSFYKYSDSSDVYREQSDEFTADLKVKGSCSTSSGTVNVTSVVLSDETPKAVIGSQTIVEATIKNTGASAATYSISVSGNSQWSQATIDPRTVTIEAGEPKTVSIYLDINSNATEGDNYFTIKAASGTSVDEQEVKLTLEKGLTGSAIIDHFKAYWLFYVIAIVFLILIMVLIIVIRNIVAKS